MPLTSILGAGVLALASMASASTDIELGHWRAWLDCPGGEMPFQLELRADPRDDRPFAAYVINGEERVEFPVVAWEGDELVLSLDYYDAHLRAKVSGDGKRLEGEFTKMRSTGMVSMPFHAEELRAHSARVAAGEQRLERAPRDMRAAEGRWLVTFAGETDHAIAVIAGPPPGDRHEPFAGSADCTATFLTTTGDYRYLGGEFDGSRLRLSVFDGAHAFLITADVQPDGSLKGDFWSGSWHHDTWTAVRDDHAALPDAFSLVSPAPKGNVNTLTFPDLDGATRSLTDESLGGLTQSGAPAAEARILYVFGSWCPNCKDATALLNELQEKHKDAGLRVIGLAFEATGDRERDAKQARLYMNRSGISFPVLLAGKADKDAAAAALAPIITGLRAWPTAIFVDRAGRVRAVYTGFNGPATGEEHAKLRAQWSKIVQGLLSE